MINIHLTISKFMGTQSGSLIRFDKVREMRSLFRFNTLFTSKTGRD